MSNDYKIVEDKSYRILKIPLDSKWKTVTVSVEEWDKLMTVVEAAENVCGSDGEHYVAELWKALEALEK